MMNSKTMLMILALVVIIFSLGCLKKGSAEKVGEKVDDALDKVQQKAEDVEKYIKESVNEEPLMISD